MFTAFGLIILAMEITPPWQTWDKFILSCSLKGPEAQRRLEKLIKDNISIKTTGRDGQMITILSYPITTPATRETVEFSSSIFR